MMIYSVGTYIHLYIARRLLRLPLQPLMSGEDKKKLKFKKVWKQDQVTTIKH